MPQAPQSNKHLQITKANTTLVVFIAIAALVTTFSLVATRAILVKRSYQNRVIAEKQKAADQLQANIKAVDSLVASYQAFINQQENIIGGGSAGTGERDGDNAKLILDALPSTYDFPALATTLEKILLSRNVNDRVISGTDDEIAQKAAAATAQAPVEIPFQMSATGSYASILDLINDFDHSIRPIQITTLQLTGDDADMQLNINAKTFYQPEKKLNISKKVVQ